MSNVDEIKSLIRFALEQLTRKNAQHDFEHLTRHLARKKICYNILPATGPVQAGGDQGRDFETFRSYISKTSIANSISIGLAGKKIVFAASLQKDPEKRKIKEDITTITKSGTKVDIIYFFSSRDIDITKRHKLQEWAKNDKNIELEIIDANAISEMLTDSDVFWIANKYLSMPNEIYPRPLNEDEEYKELLKEWRDKKDLNYSYEEFIEIKNGARFVYESEELKQDLPIWLDKLELFIKSEKVQRDLRRKAIYEICIISFVGLRILIGKEELLKEIFNNIKNINDVLDLEDIAVLLTIVFTAKKINSINIEKCQLEIWENDLKEKILERIKKETNRNFRCYLYEIMAFFQIDFRNIEKSDYFNLRYNEFIKNLDQIIKILNEAPLYPLERLSRRINKYLGMFLEHKFSVDIDKLERIAQEIDDKFLPARFGKFEAAQNYKDRALIYYDNNELTKAISLLHKAKINWFADETLKGSLLSMLILSECYLKLGMTFASKYYALASAQIAINTGKEELFNYFPKSISIITDCDYLYGAWNGYFDFTLSLLIASSMIHKKPITISQNEDYSSVIYNSSLIKYFNEKFKWNVDDLINKQMSKLGEYINEDIDVLLNQAKEVLKDKTEEEVWNIFLTQFHYSPYNDLGPIRKIAWKAYGIEWQVKFKNEYLLNSVAEQFIAILQILQVELSNIDLHNVKGTIEIELIESDNELPDFKKEFSDTDSKWTITIPNSMEKKEKKQVWEIQSHYISYAISMIYEFSLLPYKEFYEMINNKFKEDLNSKILTALPYEVIYRKFIGRENFNEFRIKKYNISFGKNFVLKTVNELEWKDKISPKYIKKNEEVHLKNRYARSVIPINITLNKWKNEIWFKDLIKDLKSEGWQDWHLLIAIMNIVVQFKAEMHLNKTISPDILDNTIQELINKNEADNYIEIPKNILTKESILRQLDVLFASFAISSGFEIHNRKLNPKTLKEFLAKRFNILTDDIEHEPILN